MQFFDTAEYRYAMKHENDANVNQHRYKEQLCENYFSLSSILTKKITLFSKSICVTYKLL